jgi:hypothetical protein
MTQAKAATTVATGRDQIGSPLVVEFRKNFPPIGLDRAQATIDAVVKPNGT